MQVSSHTPVWDQWQHGWWSQNLDTYNPRHYLTPRDVARMRQQRTFTRTLSTFPSQPNPYFERKVEMAYYTREEKGRLGQDINWMTLGTRGG